MAIGNAPTALFEVCDLIRRGECRPALVVGVPIGFVGAAESHDELASLDCEWITASGPKGGSPVAAAVVNAIIRLALKDAPPAPEKGGRRGFTTGSCAAAAAKAGATLLVTGEAPCFAELRLPSGGAVLRIPVEACELSPSGARCSVRKDAGDDPTSPTACSSSQRSRSPKSGITISGGRARHTEGAPSLLESGRSTRLPGR